MLEAAGFYIGDEALDIWRELGGLRIRSAAHRDPPASLYIDPVDACIDALDESLLLGERYGTRFSPLGMWASQFRSYLGANGLVIAVALKSLWELGETFQGALEFTVNGADDDREIEAEWLRQ